jgi:hypothetical protein
MIDALQADVFKHTMRGWAMAIRKTYPALDSAISDAEYALAFGEGDLQAAIDAIRHEMINFPTEVFVDVERGEVVDVEDVSTDHWVAEVGDVACALFGAELAARVTEIWRE